jgi:hypothetical protein
VDAASPSALIPLYACLMQCCRLLSSCSCPQGQLASSPNYTVLKMLCIAVSRCTNFSETLELYALPEVETPLNLIERWHLVSWYRRLALQADMPDQRG